VTQSTVTMNILTVIPGSLSSPIVSTGHVCNCFHGYTGQSPPKSPGVPWSPSKDSEIFLRALEYLSKSLW